MVEESLKKYSGLSDQSFTDEYSKYQNLSFNQKTDDEYFQILKLIVFYSGFKAETVTNKLDIINSHLPDYKTISLFGKEQIESMLADKKMIKNKLKIGAIVKNAKTFKSIISQYGSFHNYISKFNPATSFENLMLLKEELEYRFAFLGGITVYHFLTDIGLPVLKPDRVLTRIFKRLNLIEDERQLLKTVLQGLKFAEATGKPIRYIDIIFVTYGQQGINGICLSKNPKCSLCGLANQCPYYAQLKLP
ncbi:MAG: DNA-3-methyladenine glycosylase I, partial [Ferruginibacter sp.]